MRHDIAFDEPFVYSICPNAPERLIREKPVQLRRIENDGLRLVFVAGFNVSEESPGKLRKKRRCLRRNDPNFALRKCSAARRFHLTRGARIALLRALLNMLAIEDEVISVDVPAFEDGHGCASLNVLGLVQLIELPRIRVPLQTGFIAGAKFCGPTFLRAKALVRESLKEELFAARASTCKIAVTLE
jgi:hypothetical protein